MDRNDDLPKFICDECFKKLKYAKELKDVCIQSDLLLRSENIKQEDFEEVNGFDFEELIEYKDESDSIQRAPPKQKKSLEKIVVETGVPAANSNIFLIQESKPKENRQEVQNLRPIILPKSSESTNRKPNLIISSNRLKIQIQNSTVFQEFEETTGRTRNVLNKPRQMVKKAHYSGQLEEADDTEDRVPNLPPKVRQLECVDCKKLYNADVDHKCAGKKTCSICEIQVESSSQLSKHLNVFHVSDRECRVCQFKLTSAKNLHYHLRTHMPGCSFICDVCGNVCVRVILMQYYLVY